MSHYYFYSSGWLNNCKQQGFRSVGRYRGASEAQLIEVMEQIAETLIRPGFPVALMRLGEVNKRVAVRMGKVEPADFEAFLAGRKLQEHELDRVSRLAHYNYQVETLETA